MAELSVNRSYVQSAMERYSVPGVAIGVTSGGKRRLETFGVVALDTGFNVRSDTLFQIGSVTKPFTATLIMALADAGSLSIDDPAIYHVPELKLGSTSATNSITIRQLLTHQAGFWGDWFDDFGLGDDAMEQFVSHFHTLPQMFEPGTMWTYNNCGYILAGLAASRITGKTFEHALADIVLEPLGLDHTFLAAADAISFPVAVGHMNADSGAPVVARRFLRPRARNPAGGILASVDDVLSFAELHLGHHDVILAPDTIRAMRTPNVDTYESGASWGLGFKIDDFNGIPVVGHGGATNGFRAQLAMIPDQDFAVVVLTNSDSGSYLAEDVVNHVLAENLGLSPPENPTVDSSENEAAVFAETYRHPYASIEIQVTGIDVRARLSSHSPYSEQSEPQHGDWCSLRYIGNDRFIAIDGPLERFQLKFWIDSDSQVRFLQAGGRLYVPGEWENLKGETSWQ